MLTPTQEQKIISYQKMIDKYSKKYENSLDIYYEKIRMYSGEIKYEMRCIRFPHIEENLKEIEKMCNEIRTFTIPLNTEYEYLNKIKEEYDSYLRKLGLVLGDSSYDERTYNLINNHILVDL
jgi:hypothetical protein